jgi:hypothetical protein
VFQRVNAGAAHDHPKNTSVPMNVVLVGGRESSAPRYEPGSYRAVDRPGRTHTLSP